MTDSNLPPLREDELLIDSLKRNPRTVIGSTFGQEALEWADKSTGLPPECVVGEIDAIRKTLHQVSLLGGVTTKEIMNGR